MLQLTVKYFNRLQMYLIENYHNRKFTENIVKKMLKLPYFWKHCSKNDAMMLFVVKYKQK